jgi:1,4-dihydroxy-2-naphthoate octaprenyltransferase
VGTHGLRKQISVLIYGAFLLCAYLSIIMGVYCEYLPRNGLTGLASMVVAIPTFFGVFRYAEDIERLIPYMGSNVIVVITTPVLVAIGFLVG